MKHYPTPKKEEKFILHDPEGNGLLEEGEDLCGPVTMDGIGGVNSQIDAAKEEMAQIDDDDGDRNYVIDIYGKVGEINLSLTRGKPIIQSTIIWDGGALVEHHIDPDTPRKRGKR